MQIAEIMTRDVQLATPRQTLQEAASDKRLVGIVAPGDLATTDGTGDEAKDAIAGASEKFA